MSISSSFLKHLASRSVFSSFLTSPLTRRIMTDSAASHKHTNKLINETSPYLLQHAHNPVEWYPYGAEALEKARREDKPILLSIGYSACHWCHVMETESFENEKIADIMNKNYVCIKVDREERPDLDKIYMTAVTALTRKGGWPLTAFLLPQNQRCFYGGTYFPPEDRFMMPGFKRVLLKMADMYKDNRAIVEDQAQQLVDCLEMSSSHFRQSVSVEAGLKTISVTHLNKAGNNLISDFDSTNGGFGHAPKFPHTMELEFLLRIHLTTTSGGNKEPADCRMALEVVERSLVKMAEGGIYDQLGGGFHRYTVDANWLTPHFEKMLYDNALLARLYIHAFVITGKPLYKQIACQTLDYVTREMTSPDGGFYSSQDADSEGVEGKYFVWTTDEIDSILGADTIDSKLFRSKYDVTERGNFEHKNILHVIQTDAQLSSHFNLPEDVVAGKLKTARDALFKVREKRVKPGRDDKALTSWNGLMLRAFAEAARYFNNETYLSVAKKNADFLLDKMILGGRVLRTYKDGIARLNGYLEDYVCLIDGLLAVYEVDLDFKWMNRAHSLLDSCVSLFKDNEKDGFFDTGTDHEELVIRPKEVMDNATPSGNSVAADILLKFSNLTGNTEYKDISQKYLCGMMKAMLNHPQAFSHALGALDYLISGSSAEIVVICEQPKDASELLSVINSKYLPNAILVCGSSSSNEGKEVLLKDKNMIDNKTTVYICQNNSCGLPITETGELEKRMNNFYL